MLNERVVEFYQDRSLRDKIDLDLLKRGAWVAQQDFTSNSWTAEKIANIHAPSNGQSGPYEHTQADTKLPSNERATNHHLEIVASQHSLSIREQDSAGQRLESAPVDLEQPLPEGKKFVTKEEAEALKREIDGAFKSLTKSSIIILATCALGAVAQGWTQESIVGANLKWPIDLHIARNTSASDATISWHYFEGKDGQGPDKGLELFSLVNAITYFAACLIGAWVTDPLTYIYGRRGALLFSGVCTLAGPIGASYCNTWVQLFFCRLIQGVGVGAKSSVVPVIESEVFQAEIRGRLLVSWQTFVAVGIFLGTSSNLIFSEDWRRQIGIAFIPAVPLLCLCYVIPEYEIIPAVKEGR